MFMRPDTQVDEAHRRLFLLWHSEQLDCDYKFVVVTGGLISPVARVRGGDASAQTRRGTGDAAARGAGPTAAIALHIATRPLGSTLTRWSLRGAR